MRFLSFIRDLVSAIFIRPEEVKTHPMNTPTPPTVPQDAPIVPPTAPNRFSTTIVSWAHLTALEEGAKPELNNPGNLKFSPLTKSWGGEKGFEAKDGGWICRFPTYEQGFDALCNLLTLACENELVSYHSPSARTFEGFTKIYAGNPTQGYIDAIAKGLGCSLDTQISSFL